MRDAEESLIELCAEYGLPDEVGNGLQHQAHQVHVWLKEILPNDWTLRQRADALAKVSALAMELAIFVDSLPGDIRFLLNQEYFGRPSGEAELQARLQLSARLMDPAPLAVEGSVLPDIAEAANRVAARSVLLPTSSGPGRPRIVDQQAHFIARIAECVMQAGIAPSNGGRFRALCEAVFEAASVTFPERALRHFLREIRPDMKDDGRCL